MGHRGTLRIAVEVYHLDEYRKLFEYGRAVGALLESLSELEHYEALHPDYCDQIAEARSAWERLELELAEPDPDQERDQALDRDNREAPGPDAGGATCPQEGPGA